MCMYIELIVMYTIGTLIVRRSKNNYLCDVTQE